MKQFIKRLFFGEGIRQKRIFFGLASNIQMNIDLGHKVQRYLGLEEKEIHRFFRTYASQCRVFVDIGASDGYYGLIYNKLNQQGEIFLCDADPTYEAQQRSHFAMNNYSSGKVNYITKYVSDISDETHIELDDLLKNFNERIFIKIDVDGGELHVLQGVEKVLRKDDCKIIVETHSKELERNCISYLQGLGYTTGIIPNAWWRAFIPEKRPIPHNRWFWAEKTNSQKGVL